LDSLRLATTEAKPRIKQVVMQLNSASTTRTFNNKSENSLKTSSGLIIY